MVGSPSATFHWDEGQAFGCAPKNELWLLPSSSFQLFTSTGSEIRARC